MLLAVKAVVSFFLLLLVFFYQEMLSYLRECKGHVL